MQICFYKERPTFRQKSYKGAIKHPDKTSGVLQGPGLILDNHPLEIVFRHKVLNGMVMLP